MILINLLPVRDIIRRKNVRNQLAMTSFVFLGLLGCFLTVEIMQLDSIKYLENEEKRLINEKQPFTKIMEEIKKIEGDRKILLTQINVIDKLKQSSSLTVHVLDEIAKFTPPNRMWLQSMSQNGTQLTLTGMALDDQTIATYMEELEGSSYINNVRLTSSAMAPYAGRSLKLFTISAQVAVLDR